MKVVRTLCGVIVASLLLSGTALAGYQPSNDLRLSLTVAPELLTTSSTTGTYTFELQESAHDLLTDSTGASVDHYYIWIDVNGEDVAAIDPLCGYSVR